MQGKWPIGEYGEYNRLRTVLCFANQREELSGNTYYPNHLSRFSFEINSVIKYTAVILSTQAEIIDSVQVQSA